MNLHSVSNAGIGLRIITQKWRENNILRKGQGRPRPDMVIRVESVCSKYIGQLARKGLTEKRLEKGQVKLCQSWERHGWNQKEGGYRSTWVSLVGPRRTLPISG